MNDARPLPIWAGRTAALLGILLVALTLRQAVAAISPILADIRVDIPLSSGAQGVLGMLPPILFAASGFLTPPIVHRLGIERALVLALGLMIVGHLGRAFAPNLGVLVAASVVTLLGMGLGNVLLPPAVRRYFPDRIGLLTASYACILSFSTALPSLVAAPLANSVGWRFSLGIWAVTAVIALVPWLSLLRTSRLDRATEFAENLETPPPSLIGRLWRSRVALSIALVFAASTVSMYAGLAWLPEILTDLTGATQTEAGILLAVFGLVGAPGSVIAPLLVARMRNVAWIILFGVAVFAVGYLGLILAPAAATLLWVSCLGVGPILFPVCLVLINQRTRTPHGAVALSGFAQGIGYTVGAFGPLVVGLLHDATGSWTAPLVVLLLVTLSAVFPGIALRKHRFVEDELVR